MKNSWEYQTAGHFQEFEDEYLEMMYQFLKKTRDKVRTGDLAEALRVTPLPLQRWFKDLLRKVILNMCRTRVLV